MPPSQWQAWSKLCPLPGLRFPCKSRSLDKTSHQRVPTGVLMCFLLLIFQREQMEVPKGKRPRGAHCNGAPMPAECYWGSVCHVGDLPPMRPEVSSVQLLSHPDCWLSMPPSGQSWLNSLWARGRWEVNLEPPPPLILRTPLMLPHLEPGVKQKS